jgi:glycosyltransferase involved in cell wall biosynthesis
MRILVGTDQWFPDYRGGSARLATETSDRLAAAGHQVTVIAPRTPGLAQVEEQGGRRLRRAIPRSWVPRTILDGPAVWRAAHRETERFDLLLSHHPAAAAGLKAAGLDAPLVHVFHASPRREARSSRIRRKRPAERLAVYPLEPLLGRLERMAVTCATRVLVLSEYSRSLVERDHGANIPLRRVPGAVDTAAFAPADGRDAARLRLGLPSSGTILVAVRRLDAGLGLDELLSAFAQLSDPSVSLAVVGSGPLEAELRSKTSSLAGRVMFPGAAGDGELGDWYRAADLFVLPPAPHEGFGLATVEALACGTPAVGAGMGATPEILLPLDPRLVAPAVDPASFSGAIQAALTFATSDGFRKACREYAVEHFSWQAALPQWERELEEAAARASRDKTL